MLKLLEFDFVIQYKKGSDNTAANALSRKDQLDSLSMPVCKATTMAVPSWTTDITTSYSQDE
jgi:hypothetical protein